MNRPSPRRSFLGRLAGGLAAVSLSGLARPIEAEVPEMLDRRPELDPRAAPPVESWDLSWVDRVRGQYRQVFDAPEIAEGAVLHATRMFLSGFGEVYGADDAQLSAVMVIRHAAIPMVANDRLWDELELGKRFECDDPETGKPARRNPFLQANVPRGAKHAMIWPDGGLDTLIGRGVIGLACNLALFRLVSMVAKRERLDAGSARETVLANLVPGVVVQPSGIFAVARAQAAGCHYLRAT